MTDYVAPVSGDGAVKSSAKTRAAPKLKEAAASAQEAYGSLKDVAVAAVSETRERVADLASEAAGAVERRYGDLQAWVQLRPGQALGLAAGLGVVAGLLLRGNAVKTIYLRDQR